MRHAIRRGATGPGQFQPLPASDINPRQAVASKQGLERAKTKGGVDGATVRASIAVARIFAQAKPAP